MIITTIALLIEHGKSGTLKLTYLADGELHRLAYVELRNARRHAICLNRVLAFRFERLSLLNSETEGLFGGKTSESLAPRTGCPSRYDEENGTYGETDKRGNLHMREMRGETFH